MEQLGLTLRRTTRDGRRHYVRASQIPENDLHAAVAKLLDAVLDPAWTFWTTMPSGGGKLDPRTGARLARLGLKSGVPDILLFWQADYCECGGIELKTEDGKLSKTKIVHSKRGRSRVVLGQEDVHEMMRRAGVLIAVARSLDDVKRILKEWGVPRRISAGG